MFIMKVTQQLRGSLPETRESDEHALTTAKVPHGFVIDYLSLPGDQLMTGTL